MDAKLHNELTRLIRRKFAGYPNVASLADDIVNDAYIRLKSSQKYEPQKENFGYLSTVCIRLAYKIFMAQSANFGCVYLDAEGTTLIDETEITDEIIRSENASAVLESLKVLRDIERVVITQRYYGDFSFAEIAKANDLKLNTVLSHHRRALSKLRPQLTKLLGFGKEQYHD